MKETATKKRKPQKIKVVLLNEPSTEALIEVCLMLLKIKLDLPDDDKQQYAA